MATAKTQEELSRIRDLLYPLRLHTMTAVRRFGIGFWGPGAHIEAQNASDLLGENGVEHELVLSPWTGAGKPVAEIKFASGPSPLRVASLFIKKAAHPNDQVPVPYAELTEMYRELEKIAQKYKQFEGENFTWVGNDQMQHGRDGRIMAVKNTPKWLSGIQIGTIWHPVQGDFFGTPQERAQFRDSNQERERVLDELKSEVDQVLLPFLKKYQIPGYTHPEYGGGSAYNTYGLPADDNGYIRWVMKAQMKDFDWKTAQASKVAYEPPFHLAAKADEALGQAYLDLVSLKAGFDSWEELPKSAHPLYNWISKSLSAVANARKETTQVRELVRKKKY